MLRVLPGLSCFAVASLLHHCRMFQTIETCEQACGSEPDAISDYFPKNLLLDINMCICTPMACILSPLEGITMKHLRTSSNSVYAVMSSNRVFAQV